MRGTGRVWRRGQTWFIQYSFDGTQYRESARTKSKTEACDILRTKLEALASGQSSMEGRKLTVDTAIDEYLANLELRRGDVAVYDLSTHARPVRDVLGSVLATNLTAARIDAYARGRLKAPKLRGAGTISPTKVNRELGLLKSAMRFAYKRGKLGRVPGFTLLSEPAPRQGFWSSLGEFKRFVGHLPEDDLRDLAWAGYLLGWRRSELFGLRWEWVDMNATPHPEVRIPRTKNREPRVVPLVGKLKELFERRRERRKLTRPDRSAVIAELVFHRDGEPIGDIRDPWHAALREAGLPPRLWHDFRRTACRNFVNAGVAEKIAMEITGHLTASIFRRYHIVAQADKAEALRKTLAYVEAEQVATNVLPLRKPVAASPRDQAYSSRPPA